MFQKLPHAISLLILIIVSVWQAFLGLQKHIREHLLGSARIAS
jgi:hypothetical protein